MRLRVGNHIRKCKRSSSEIEEKNYMNGFMDDLYYQVADKTSKRIRIFFFLDC